VKEKETLQKEKKKDDCAAKLFLWCLGEIVQLTEKNERKRK